MSLPQIPDSFASSLSKTLSVGKDKTVTLDEIRKCTSSSSLTRNLSCLLVFMRKGVWISNTSLGTILSDQRNLTTLSKVVDSAKEQISYLLTKEKGRIERTPKSTLPKGQIPTARKVVDLFQNLAKAKLEYTFESSNEMVPVAISLNAEVQRAEMLDYLENTPPHFLIRHMYNAVSSQVDSRLIEEFAKTNSLCQEHLKTLTEGVTGVSARTVIFSNKALTAEFNAFKEKNLEKCQKEVIAGAGSLTFGPLSKAFLDFVSKRGVKEGNPSKEKHLLNLYKEFVQTLSSSSKQDLVKMQQEIEDSNDLNVRMAMVNPEMSDIQAGMDDKDRVAIFKRDLSVFRELVASRR